MSSEGLKRRKTRHLHLFLRCRQTPMTPITKLSTKGDKILIARDSFANGLRQRSVGAMLLMNTMIIRLEQQVSCCTLIMIAWLTVIHIIPVPTDECCDVCTARVLGGQTAVERTSESLSQSAESWSRSAIFNQRTPATVPDQQNLGPKQRRGIWLKDARAAPKKRNPNRRGHLARSDTALGACKKTRR